MSLLGGSMETIKITVDKDLPNKETIEAIDGVTTSNIDKH